jgi:hypothetical protein
MKTTGRPRGRKKDAAKLYAIKILLKNPNGLKSREIKGLVEKELGAEQSSKWFYPHLRELTKRKLIKEDFEESATLYRIPELKSIKEKEAYCDRLRTELKLRDSACKMDILSLLGLNALYFKKGLYQTPNKAQSEKDLKQARAEEIFYASMDDLKEIYSSSPRSPKRKIGPEVARRHIENIDQLLVQLPKKSRPRYLLDHTKQLLEMYLNLFPLDADVEEYIRLLKIKREKENAAGQ